MITSNTLVSVIIPFFNAEDHIYETIHSVLSQTHSNLEVICVDDGSNDRSIDVINEIAQNDGRITLTKRNRLPKSGSTCRNIGASLAKGEYIIFLDADDVLDVNCIEKRLLAIEGTDYFFVVYPMASFSDSINHWSMTSRLNVKDFKYFFASGFAAWQVTSPIWKKNFFLNKLNGFDESFQRLQDIELHFRAIVASEGNYMIMRNNNPDCFYRKTPSGGIRHHKMLATLAAYEHFSALLERFYRDGVFENKSRFSDSVLIMYLTMMTTVNLLYRAGVYDYDRKRIEDINLRRHLVWYDKVLYKIVWKITNPKLGAMAARVIRRICQYRFL